MKFLISYFHPQFVLEKVFYVINNGGGNNFYLRLPTLLLLLLLLIFFFYTYLWAIPFLYKRAINGGREDRLQRIRFEQIILLLFYSLILSRCYMLLVIYFIIFSLNKKNVKLTFKIYSINLFYYFNLFKILKTIKLFTIKVQSVFPPNSLSFQNI